MIVRIIAFVLLTVCLAVLQDYKYHIPAVNSTIHTLLGTALGLLLVFRTNASYDRYWEGRKMWGQIANNVRALVRVAHTNCTAKGPGEIEGIAALVAAFPLAVKHALRKTVGSGELDELLKDQAVVHKIAEFPHMGTAILMLISSWVAEKTKKNQLEYWAARTIEGYLQLLGEAQGALDRIKDTPIPFAYAVHTHQFLMLYLITLPFTMVVTYQYYGIVAVFIISFGLLGIDEAGVEIEDPFGFDDNDLPLDAMCDKLKNLTAAMAKFEAIPLRIGENGSSSSSSKLAETGIVISSEPAELQTSTSSTDLGPVSPTSAIN